LWPWSLFAIQTLRCCYALANRHGPEEDSPLAKIDRDSRKIKETLDLVRQFIQLTKTEYDMYFMGINKTPPKDKERELRHMFRDLQDTVINNTALRFRLKTLRARYNTLRMFWLRTCKQIEEGTYRKHRVMANLRQERNQGGQVGAAAVREQIKALARGEEVPEHAVEKTVWMEAVKDDEGSGGRARPARPRGQSRQAHDIGSADLVREYASMRAKLGLSGKVDSAKLEKKLRAHANKLKKQYGLRDVRFRVEAEGGKAKLKAIPVK